MFRDHGESQPTSRSRAPRAAGWSTIIVAWGGLALGVIGTTVSVVTYTNTRSELADAREERAAALYKALDFLGTEFNRGGFRLGAVRDGTVIDARRLEEARRAIERFAALTDNETEADLLYFTWAVAAGNIQGAREIAAKPTSGIRVTGFSTVRRTRSTPESQRVHVDLTGMCGYAA
jgi:hypothetical protein